MSGTVPGSMNEMRSIGDVDTFLTLSFPGGITHNPESVLSML